MDFNFSNKCFHTNELFRFPCNGDLMHKQLFPLELKIILNTQQLGLNKGVYFSCHCDKCFILLLKKYDSFNCRIISHSIGLEPDSDVVLGSKHVFRDLLQTFNRDSMGKSIPFPQIESSFCSSRSELVNYYFNFGNLNERKINESSYQSVHLLRSNLDNSGSISDLEKLVFFFLGVFNTLTCNQCTYSLLVLVTIVQK